MLLGEGSARRTVKAPGYLDARAEPFDTAVADALAAGDPQRLLGLTGPGAELLADRRPGLGARRPRASPAGTGPPSCCTPTRRTASATSSRRGRRAEGRRRRRPDGDREVRPRRRARPAARRGDRQRRLDAAVRGHGHRHGEARAGRARRRAAPPARRLAAGEVGGGRGVPDSCARGDPRDPRPAAGRRCWSAGRGCTCAGRWTGWTSRGSRRRCAPRSTPSWTSSGPRRCTPAWREVDPAAAAAILPSNGRRIARALEVITVTGQPFLARMPPFESIFDTVQVGLDRADLDERVERRVHRMMELGLLDEIRRLLPLGLRDSPTAGQGAGLPAGARVRGRRRHGHRRSGRGGGGDGPRHAALRAPAAAVVPARPAHPLARRRRPRPRSTMPCGTSTRTAARVAAVPRLVPCD